jgi:hypothetical protein
MDKQEKQSVVVERTGCFTSIGSKAFSSSTKVAV